MTNVVWAVSCVTQFVGGPTGIAVYWGHCGYRCCRSQGGGGSEVRREGRGRGALLSSLMVLWDVDANSLSCDDISIGE
jgi:hypothetical protein